jgi:type I restriction enzyme R subunit
VDTEIQHTKKDDWRGNRIKEREVRLAIRKHVGDEALTDRILELVKTQREY